MSHWSIFILFVNHAFVSAFGPGDGGAGGVFVCPKPDGTFEARLIDLWEAERTTFQGRSVKIKYSEEDPEVQFDRAMQKLERMDPEFARAVRREKETMFGGPDTLRASEKDLSSLSSAERVRREEFLRELKKSRLRQEALREDEEMPLPDDLKILLKPKGCEAKGIMYYVNDTGKLKVDQTLFPILRTNTDIAAAWVHESVYKVLRDRKDHRDSKLTRRLTGCLFSDNRECLKARLSRLEEGFVGFHCQNENFSVSLVPKFARVSFNGNTLEKKDPGTIGEREQFLVYVHRMNGLDLAQTVSTLSTLSISSADQDEPVSGPLSLYGYEPKLWVEAKLLEPGKVGVTAYGHSSVEGYHVSATSELMRNRPLVCKPIRGRPGGTILDGRYHVKSGITGSSLTEEPLGSPDSISAQ